MAVKEQTALVKISDAAWPSHLLFACSVLLLLISNDAAYAQTEHTPISLSDADIQAVIAEFKTDHAADWVGRFRERMPARVTNAELRATIHRELPAQFLSLAVSDQALVSSVREVIKPVLDLYDRTGTYDLVIIDTPIPMTMADSGVVLTVSTGLLKRARSDDELLGYVAHEVGHEFFIKYSVYSKYLLGLVEEGGNELGLQRHIRQILAVIELECDAFAALTMASLGYNPVEVIKSIENISQEFSDYRDDKHPRESQRRRVVEAILPVAAYATATRRSEPFLRLQHLLEDRKTTKSASR